MSGAILNLGFRVFFVAAAAYAAVSMCLWATFFFGIFTPPVSAIRASLWHAHEMVYGYAIAVIAGFLLTAVTNWTGRKTPTGLPLLALVSLWAMGRVGMITGWVELAFAFDVIFLVCLIWAISVPIIQAKQWQQLAIVSKLVLLLVSNAVFYLGFFGILQNGLSLGVYSGLYLLIGLILMMGRRVLPFFAKEATQGQLDLPNAVWIDRLSLILFLLFYIAELTQYSLAISAYLALSLFILYSIRLWRWHDKKLWDIPLLWVLYLSLWCISTGFLLLFLSLYFPLPKTLAIHAMAIGGVGLITVGMMARVTLGHTGRDVSSPPKLTVLIFALLLIGTVVRVALPAMLPSGYLWWVGISQLLWVLSYLLFLGIYMPMLIRVRADGNPG